MPPHADSGARTSSVSEKDLEHARGEPMLDREPGAEPSSPVGEMNAAAGAAMSAHSPAAFPDGGATAWLCVLGGFCCSFCSYGWINCIGIFQNYYEQNQLSAYSSSEIAWIPSLEVFCMLFGGFFIGKAYDALGPRYLVLAGSVLHVFGLMMASISSKYWHFILTQGIVSAVGTSMIFYPAVNCVATWFFKRRAFAMGLMFSGSSLGGVIFPIMIRQLIPRVGFGWSMRIAAFLILGMMIIANLTLRSRLPPKGWTGMSVGEFVRPFRDRSFALVTAGSFLFFWGMFLPFTYLPLYAQSRGMSASLANYLVSMLNAASVFGRILPGYIGDRVGRFNAVVVISYASGVLILALWLPSTGHAPIIVFAVLYGFTTGAFVSLTPSVIAQISDIREIGVRTGSMFGAVSFAALTGSPIGGAILSKMDGDWLGLQVWSGIAVVLGSCLFLWSRVVVGGASLRTVV